MFFIFFMGFYHMVFGMWENFQQIKLLLFVLLGIFHLGFYHVGKCLMAFFIVAFWYVAIFYVGDFQICCLWGF